MPGRAIRVVEMREFNFNDLAGPSVGHITAAQHIDVSGAREVEMAVRWHSGTIGAATSVDIIAFPDGHTMEDPTNIFLDSASGTVSFTANASAPQYTTVKLGEGSDAPMGAMLTIWVSGNMPTAVANIEPTLSIDLVLRD